MMKSFGQAFSKACAVEAAKASSLSAESEIPLTAFSFDSFSLAPPSCKRKAAKEPAASDELPFWESFGQAFSKACEVEGAEPSSLSAESEIPLTAFSFASFSLAPPSCKRKAAKEFAVSNELPF
ncbi:MAG: hypothetical protein J6B71_03850 [Clostridia bacterium]|nr:hypothetical protein [Clostridia bacterium]